MIQKPETLNPLAHAFDAVPIGTVRARHDVIVHLQDDVPAIVVRKGGPALGPVMRFAGKRND